MQRYVPARMVEMPRSAIVLSSDTVTLPSGTRVHVAGHYQYSREVELELDYSELTPIRTLRKQVAREWGWPVQFLVLYSVTPGSVRKARLRPGGSLHEVFDVDSVLQDETDDWPPPSTIPPGGKATLLAGELVMDDHDPAQVAAYHAAIARRVAEDRV